MSEFDEVFEEVAFGKNLGELKRSTVELMEAININKGPKRHAELVQQIRAHHLAIEIHISKAEDTGVFGRVFEGYFKKTRQMDQPR